MTSADLYVVPTFPRQIRMKSDLFSPKANLGIVVRGHMGSLNAFWEGFEELCREHDLKIAFKTASASRLWVKEDEENDRGA